MAWEDHEELKPLSGRSTRYKLTYWDEYPRSVIEREIDDAVKSPYYEKLAWKTAGVIGYKPRVRVKAGSSPCE